MKLSPSSRDHGFSLTEVLVVIAVVAILGVLLMPVINTQLDKARGSRCLSRLRQVFVYFNAYAADHNMTVSFLRDGKTSRMWYTELQRHAALSDGDAQRAFGCPSLPEEKVSSWVCYGFRLGKLGDSEVEPGRTARPQDASGDIPSGFFEIPLLRVKYPSRYFLFGDTGTSSGSQTFRIIPPGFYANTGIQTRHQERANFLFLDGHVEALNRFQLGELGITKIYNQAGVETSTGNDS